MENKVISEYGYIYYIKPEKLNNKYIHTNVSEKEFNELYRYWINDKEAKKIFEFDGYSLKATNYVGVVQTENLSIEILPKIYSDNNNEAKTRTIFIEMLKPLLNINDIQINKANLSTTTNKNIYEMFITMFIEYLDKLIHRGLKSHYVSKEDNQNFLKGKLKFNQHIKHNHIHKERFYVEYDEYLEDRAENRLLKSTIELLLKKTNNDYNKRLLRQQLFVFNEIRYSSNYDIDIQKINIYRGMEYYEVPLRFAKLFLKHQSFTSLRGDDNVFALFFPMEKVFEDYIEFILNNFKDNLGIDEVLVNGGKDEYFITNEKCKMTRLQPDYLLTMKDGRSIVTDAKWKLLEQNKDEYSNCNTINIPSGDIYQIFSYLNFYTAQDIAYIFVPKTKEIENPITLSYNVSSTISSNYKIIIKPVDLSKIIMNNYNLTNLISKL